MSKTSLLFPYSDQQVFLNHLQGVLDNAAKKGQTITLVNIHLANSPLVAEFYGIETINNILDELCTRLREFQKSGEPVFKLQIDQLAVCLQDYSATEVEEYCARIHEFIQHTPTFVEDGNSCVYFVVSLGTALFPEDAQTVPDLITRSYFACSYVQKIPDSDWFHYHKLKDIKQRHRQLMQRANTLQTAIKNQQFRLAYQPIVNSTTGTHDYFECLLRLVDDKGNITSAWPCIEAAEELGLMADIDICVLQLVVQELERSPNVILSFNISGKTIDNPRWLNTARQLFADPDLAARSVVEITETALQHDLKKATLFVSSLQEIGCRVALDDFGTGYTSFKQLRALPIDIVKIDGSFIRDIATSHDNRLFVKTLLKLIEGFGFVAVAEFVENGEIAKLLMDIGIPYMQGNYFSAAVNHRPWVNTESL